MNEQDNGGNDGFKGRLTGFNDPAQSNGKLHNARDGASSPANQPKPESITIEEADAIVCNMLTLIERNVRLARESICMSRQLQARLTVPSLIVPGQVDPKQGQQQALVQTRTISNAQLSEFYQNATALSEFLERTKYHIS